MSGAEEGVSSDAAADAYEAADLYVGELVEVTFSEDHRWAYYRFIPEEDAWYSFYTESDYNTWAYLENEWYEELCMSYDGGENENFKISFYCNAGEVYYLRVAEENSEDCSCILYAVKPDFMVLGEETTYLTSFAGEEVTMAVDAYSASELSYTWYIGRYDWGDELSEIEEENSSYLTLTPDRGTYFSCHITDGTNEAWRYFEVNETNIVAWATGHEELKGNAYQNIDWEGQWNLQIGDSYTIQIQAETGDGSEPTFQWYQNYKLLEGATSAEFEAVLYQSDWNFFRCIVQDGSGECVEIFCQIYANGDEEDNYNDNLHAWVTGHEDEMDNQWQSYDFYSWEDGQAISVGDSYPIQIEAETRDGSAPVFMWYRDEELIEDADSSTFEAVINHSGQNVYRCDVQDQYGNQVEINLYFYAEEVDNDLHAYPEGNDIYDDTAYIELNPGETAVLTTRVSANDLEGITYQWWDRGTESILEGETSETISVDRTCGRYCLVTDRYGNTARAYFEIRIMNTIEVRPHDNKRGDTWIDIPAEAGQSYTLTVDMEADHEDLVTLTWDKISFDEMGGEIVEESVSTGSDTFETGPVTASCRYRCRASDPYGNEASAYFSLRVNDLNVQACGPDVVDLVPGGNTTLQVEVSALDMSQIQYRWTYEGDFIEGADTDTLYAEDRGNYECFVSDQYGNQESVWFYVRMNHFRAYGNGTARYEGEETDRVVTVGNGEPAELKVFVDADDPEGITYRWNYMQDYEWYEDDAADSDTYIVEDTSPGNRSAYCQVEDGYGNGATIWFDIISNNLIVYPVGGNIGDTHITINADTNDEASLGVVVSADDMDGLQIIWRDENTWEEMTEEEGKTSCIVRKSSEEEGYYYQCTVRDNYDNEIGISFEVIWNDSYPVVISGTLVDSSGRDVPGDLEGLAQYMSGEEVTLTAPKVDGYNITGWYVFSDEAPYYEGEVLSASRTYIFTAVEDADFTAVYEPLAKAAITINGGDSYLVNGSQKSSQVSMESYLGSVITLELDKEDFAYWVNSYGAVLSRESSYSFTVTGKETITAVFNTPIADKATLVFETAYNQVLARDQLAAGESMNLPTLPTVDGYNTLGWDLDGDGSYDAQSDTLAAAIDRGLAAEDRLVTIYAVYELKDESFTITVNGGTGRGSYNTNDIVLIKADAPEAGQKFSHWEDETGTILSYSASYKFFAETEKTITAVYVEEEEEVEALGTTSIINMFKDEENHKLSFVSMSTVPEGCSINTAGIIATNNAAVAAGDDTFTASTADFVRGDSWTGTSYRYTWSKGKVQEGDTWYVRAYLVYTNAEGNVITVYGDIVSQTF